MQKRIIKIDFDDFNYDNDGVDILLMVTQADDEHKFIPISTYSFDSENSYLLDNKKVVENCFNQFKNALNSESIEYNEEDFSYETSCYTDLIVKKLSELNYKDDDNEDSSSYEKEYETKDEVYKWSTYVVDTYFDRVRKGEKELTPGTNKLPKNMTFIFCDGNKYKALIKKIFLVSKSEKEKLDNLKRPAYTYGFIAFERSDCDYIIVFALAKPYQIYDKKDFTISFYRNKYCIEVVKSKIDNNGILFINLDDCEYVVDTKSDLDNTLAPMLNYYNALLNDLNAKSDQIKLEVDLDLLHEHYMVFADLNPDSDLITLPIKGLGQKINGITLSTENFNDKETKHNFYEAIISEFSNEELETNINALIENDIKLPKGETIVLLDITDLYDKDKFTVKKVLNDGNLKRLTILNNIEGEKIRLSRIISGIEKSLLGEVINKRLINTICKNNIEDRIPSLLKLHSYQRDEEYIDYLKKEYQLLSHNNEQLEAIDKIIQMDNNKVDVMLIQGPPGTGKTELILSLAKELMKKKKKVLITSNVHVACDNVVERLKNNKEIVLKRYTATKGEQYQKEIIENQKRYVENQILSGFKFEDKSISSIEAYNDLWKLTDDLKEKRNQVIKTKDDYDKKLLPYKNNQILVKTLEEQQRSNVRERNKIEADNQKIQFEINKLNAEIEAINVEKANLNEKKKQKEEKIKDYDIQKDAYDKTTVEKINEINTINDTIYKNKKEIDRLTCSIEENKKEILIKNRQLEFFESKNAYQLKMTVVKQVESNNQLSDCLKMTVEKVLPELNFINEFRKRIDEDKTFRTQNNRLNLDTLEYILFKASKSDYAHYCLTDDTILVLEDIYKFYKLGTFKKTMMSIFPFVKAYGFNFSHYKKCIDQLSRDLKSVQHNHSEIILKLIDELISEEQLTNLIMQIKKNIEILETSNNDADLLIHKYENQEEVLKSNIESNKNEINNIAKWTVELEDKIESLKGELAKFVEEVIGDVNNRYDETINKINYKVQIKNDVMERIDTLNSQDEELKEELQEIKNKITQFELENEDLIDGYKSFLNKYQIDLVNLDKKIDKVGAVIDVVDSKIEVLIKNGWKKEDALNLLFTYVKELVNIVEVEPENSKNYFVGRGSIFTNMFMLSQSEDASLISMTTSQIASLLKDTTPDELSFDYAIVDEASKCKFDDLIISLPRVKHLILIGDFMQLDPLYEDYKKLELKYQSIVNMAQWENMNKSSFSMLLNQFIEFNNKMKIDNFNNNPCVAVMKRQYRMNKGIFNVIKPIYSIHKEFELIDEKQMTSNDIKCIEIKGNEIKHGTSYFNNEEAEAIVSVLGLIKDNKEKYQSIKTIGIITGYRAQQNCLMKKLKSFKIPNTKVQIGTFDRFQGREYDLVMVSLVRTLNLGFTNNIRRMNVAFSRAKEHLLVFGNYTSLLNVARKTSNIKNITDSSSVCKENEFVTRTLIPNLYDMKEEFISKNDLLNSLNNFLKENKYE